MLPYEYIMRFDPCGTDQQALDQQQEYGCWQLVERFNIMRVVSRVTPPFNDGRFESDDMTSPESERQEFDDDFSLPTDPSIWTSTNVPLACCGPLDDGDTEGYDDPTLDQTTPDSGTTTRGRAFQRRSWAKKVRNHHVYSMIDHQEGTGIHLF